MQDAISSHLALAIQTAGVSLIAGLTSYLTRSIDRPYLRSWAAAWGCLTLALAALLVTFRWPATAGALQPVYFIGEYAFGLLLIGGCRERATGVRLRPRDARWGIPAVALGLALPQFPRWGLPALGLPLPHVSIEFSVRFIVQAGVMAALFALAFLQLEKGRQRQAGEPGLRVMSVALLLLAIEFAHYVPVLTYAAVSKVILPSVYAGYTSLYDLLFEMLLGFGTVILAMDETNIELRQARDRLERQARVDPLTEALNRHAFYSMVEESREAAPREGCVGIVDIDGLKALNDSLGHAAGDVAIRAVARAIRSVVRADDLVFRWGGDEFLVILLGLPEEEGQRRLARLEEPLRSTPVPGYDRPVAVSVSWGVAGFDAARPLERAIEIADRAMYARKQAHQTT